MRSAERRARAPGTACSGGDALELALARLGEVGTAPALAPAAEAAPGHALAAGGEARPALSIAPVISDRHEHAFPVTDSSGQTLPHNVYHLLRARGM